MRNFLVSFPCRLNRKENIFGDRLGTTAVRFLMSKAHLNIEFPESHAICYSGVDWIVILPTDITSVRLQNKKKIFYLEQTEHISRLNLKRSRNVIFKWI